MKTHKPRRRRHRPAAIEVVVQFADDSDQLTVRLDDAIRRAVDELRARRTDPPAADDLPIFL